MDVSELKSLLFLVEKFGNLIDTMPLHKSDFDSARILVIRFSAIVENVLSQLS